MHLLDWYHKMESMRRNTRREPYREELFTLFCRILKEPSKQVYRDIVHENASMTEREDVMK